MPGSKPFRLNRSGLLLALISTAFAGQAQAAAGRVEFAIGPVTVVGADGRSRPATRGIELDTGDTVQTNNGRMQVRMTDGAFISLQPNTEFGIKDYKFAGKADGSENALYSLFKGAMRTVTGLIGRTNRNRYQVATPTATVGIRGTGGLIQVQNDGSTLVQGTSGIWFLANPAGTIDIPAGVAGIAPVDPNQPPKETVQVPTAGPSPLPTLIEFVQGDERTESGENVIETSTPPGVLVSGSGYAAALALSADTCGDACIDPFLVSSTGTATFNGAGQMTEMVIGGRVSETYTLLAGGSHVEFGTDGILAWGRWIGSASVPQTLSGNENYTSDEGLHYVVGMPTPSMPLNGTATYTLLGATSPTYVDGFNATPGKLTGNLSVDFAGFTVGVNLNVAMASSTYIIGGNATFSSGTPFFSGASGQDLSISGGGCFSGCSVSVQGFFAGASAERVGLGYHISDGGFNDDIIGAAAFAKQ